MISFQNATLTYPDGDTRVTAVDQLSLEVGPGQVTAITGASGSGKSSLLALAATLIRPDSGSVVLDGTDVARISDRKAAELRREGIGIVFQQSNLLPSLTAIDQLRVMGELGQRPRASVRNEVRDRAEDLLATVGLTDHAGRRPHQLSGGQRQRINIARALMNAPSVMLVDEPTSALDSTLGGEIIDLVIRITREHHTATMLVTHDRNHLAVMDSVFEMTDGRLTSSSPVRAGSPASITAP